MYEIGRVMSKCLRSNINRGCKKAKDATWLGDKRKEVEEKKSRKDRRRKKKKKRNIGNTLMQGNRKFLV